MATHMKQPVQARTFIRAFGTGSAPIELLCEDGHSYVAKCRRANNVQQDQQMFNDQCAARLGRFIGAPVPTVALIDVSGPLIAQNPDMSHIQPGIGHGSLTVPNVTDRVNDFDHADEGTNRQRFASLAIFFGWLGGNDEQFIFEKSAPYNVYSHDHGHFFPGGPSWSVATLNDAAPAQAWNRLVNELNLTPAELQAACAPLHVVTPENIAQAIAFCPSDWGFSEAERTALAEFLNARMYVLRVAYPTL